MSSASLIGRTLSGRFRVIGFIGEGAMASVYRAVQVQQPHDVAVKVMHPHLTGDPTFVGRFRREARAAAQIQHPNTVQILDFGVDERVLYIAMELLAGQDLFETLVVERRLGERRAVRILIQICDALIAAHEKGIVHRDLKPENIMLLPPDPADPTVERVKVLDFGIAKILERDAAPASDGGEPNSMANSVLTTVGMVVGTPAYMSPEQCRGEPIDPRSDIYACGILLYQLVAGRLPFAGDNAMDLAVKHVRSEPPPIHTVIPTVNRELERVILTALGKWPAQRQASALVLKGQLEAVLPELTDEMYTGGRVEATATPVSDASRRAAHELIDADSASTLRNSPNASSDPDIAKTLTSEKALLPRHDAPHPLDATVPAGPLHFEVLAAAPPKRSIPEPDHTLASLVHARSAGWQSAPLAAKAPAAAGSSGWLLIPFALVVGIAVGVLAYFLAK